MGKLFERLRQCLRGSSTCENELEENRPLFIHGNANQSQASRTPQLLAALSATLGGFCAGTSLGWTAPVQEDVVLRDAFGFEVTTADYSVVSSLVSLGATIGSLVSGSICDRIGRKSFILANSLPCIIGWWLVIFSPNLATVFLGRFTIGLSTGAFSCACPMYNTEISSKDLRGKLGSFFQLQVVTGILFSYITGAIFPLFWFSSICSLIPIILICAMILQPESPFYYLKTHQQHKACRAMQRLRGIHYNIQEEIDAMQKTIYELEGQKMSLKEAFSSRAGKKAVGIGVTLMALQQFSGASAVIFFGSSIFKDAGSTLDPNICTIIIGLFSVFGSALSSQAVERVGRRSLLFISGFSMFIVTEILGVFFFLKAHAPAVTVENDLVRVTPLVAVCSFQIAFSLGFGPVPWFYIGEIFPASVKGSAFALACFTNWSTSFVITFAYPLVNAALQPNLIYLPFWIFGLVSLVGSIFICAVVPETKGKTLNDIQIELTGGVIKPIEF